MTHKITPPPMPPSEPYFRVWIGAGGSLESANAEYYTAAQIAARDRQWLAIVKEAVEMEREECAKDCERAQRNGFSNCATTIRSRSAT